MTSTGLSKLARKRLDRAREVIRIEARSIASLENCLEGGFLDAIDRILACEGNVVVTGMGKAGIVGQKISATLASTGTPSIFLHAAEALHGDLGRIRSRDLVLALSNSGETVETKLVLPVARKIGASLIAVTGKADSAMAKLADCVIDIGAVSEACPMGLAPTASTAALLAVGDALAMVVLAERSFGREDFALYHPAGALGRQLMRVREVMRQGEQLPLVRTGTAVREVAAVMGDTPGNPGSALVIDDGGRLVGIFTDGDLRRFVRQGLSADDPIDAHMGRDPKAIGPEDLLEEAERRLKEHRVDQIPVLDEERRPVGLLDVQDVLDVNI